MNEVIELGKLLESLFHSRAWRGDEIDQINKIKQAFTQMEHAIKASLNFALLVGFLFGCGITALYFVLFVLMESQ